MSSTEKKGNSMRFSSKINAYSFPPLFRSLDLRVFVCLAMILSVDDEAVKECPLRDYTKEECKNLVGVFNRMKVRTGVSIFIITLFGKKECPSLTIDSFHAFKICNLINFPATLFPGN